MLLIIDKGMKLHINFLKQKRINKGFTLVEMIVAVGILVGATVGPIFLAAQGIGVANEAKNRILAVYLADEGLEVIKNKRDSNLISNQNWLTDLLICQDQPCRVDAWSNSVAVCNPDASSCSLNVMAGEGVGGSDVLEKRYGHGSGAPASPAMSRWVEYTLVSQDEIRVKSTVVWREKLKEKKIELVSYLYRWN